ncbi:MAG: endonuclease/exonuclease/phosphatase family protein [Planctomycetota bacterium]
MKWRHTKRKFALLILALLSALLFTRHWLNFRDPIANRKTKPKTLPVKVVSFNAHLLPSIAESFVGKRKQSDYRAKQIGKLLKDYDVVGFCELFHEKRTQMVVEAMNSNADGFAVVRSPHPVRLSQFTNGGLALFSKLPIISHDTLTFNAGSSVLQFFKTSDFLAAKGALFVKLKLQNDEFQFLECILTHLDSSSQSIRENQLKELRQFAENFASQTNPLLIMGDFNIADDGYEVLCEMMTLTSMDLFDTATSNGRIAKGTSDANRSDGGSRIDYIFLALPKDSKSLQVGDSTTMRMLDPLVDAGCLSDHAAVYCQIEDR